MFKCRSQRNIQIPQKSFLNEMSLFSNRFFNSFCEIWSKFGVIRGGFYCIVGQKFYCERQMGQEIEGRDLFEKRPILPKIQFSCLFFQLFSELFDSLASWPLKGSTHLPNWTRAHLVIKDIINKWKSECSTFWKLLNPFFPI